ncbi:hypothetical protein LCGC14_1083820 [marine sediment metagenome]|uniref:Uncharacterized protein n=1 Tax=marine sediment metagenome TaxID=412755 RepID=A0A0F9PXP6_9ZZZZ
MSKQIEYEERCVHCGKVCTKEEGHVCNDCYSKYSAEDIADLEN